MVSYCTTTIVNARTHRKQREKWIADLGAFSLRRNHEAWNLDIAQILREEQNHKRRAVAQQNTKSVTDTAILLGFSDGEQLRIEFNRILSTINLDQ